MRLNVILTLCALVVASDFSFEIVQRLPRELQKHVFSNQNIDSLSSYQAWRLLGCFDKITTHLPYDKKDQNFLEKIAHTISFTYYYKYLGRFPEIGPLYMPDFDRMHRSCPITALLTLSKLEEKTKRAYNIHFLNQICKRAVITLHIRTLHMLSYEKIYKLKPEQFLASILHALFYELNKQCYTYEFRCEPRAQTWKKFQHLFEVRELLKKLHLLDPDYDINNCREIYYKTFHDYGVIQINNQRNHVCTIQ